MSPATHCKRAHHPNGQACKPSTRLSLATTRTAAARSRSRRPPGRTPGRPRSRGTPRGGDSSCERGGEYSELCHVLSKRPGRALVSSRRAAVTRTRHITNSRGEIEIATDHTTLASLPTSRRAPPCHQAGSQVRTRGEIDRDWTTPLASRPRTSRHEPPANHCGEKWPCATTSGYAASGCSAARWDRMVSSSLKRRTRGACARRLLSHAARVSSFFSP